MKVTVAPRPAGLGPILTVPPWRSTIAREKNKPRPMPSRLVVKNGSKTWLATSGSIPAPVSEKVMISLLSSRLNATVEFSAFGHRLDRVGHHVDEAGVKLFGVDVENHRRLSALL